MRSSTNARQRLARFAEALFAAAEKAPNALAESAAQASENLVSFRHAVHNGVMTAPLSRKGRGAATNPTGRFEAYRVEAVDDGWDSDDVPPSPRTTLTPDAARCIIARNDSPDVPFDRSINPYRGCEHGCIYCFARPSHAFLGLSPGLDFETRLFFKEDAGALLEKELSAPGYVCDVLALGANTDPYQPVERKLGITRQVLEVLAACDHPVGIVTKSGLVTRDIDILAPMAERNLVQVCVSVTTLDRSLARDMEPRAPSPSRRLETIRRLAEAGIPTGAMVAPVIPALNDHEIEAILEAAREAGAGSAGYVLLRLPLELKDLFREWLELHAPLRAKHVLAAVRETRGGRMYESAFGDRMRGSGPYAELIRQRFRMACRRFGFDLPRFSLDTARFRPPRGDQPDLFDV